MSTSQDGAVRWAARQRCVAEGMAPTVRPIVTPDMRTRLAAIEGLIDGDQLDRAASTGIDLLREVDAAVLLTWISQCQGQCHPTQEHAVGDAILQVEEAIRQGLFDGCVAAAEQEVATWDRHLVRRNPQLWYASRYWPAIARRRAWLEPAIPDLAPPPFRRLIPWPVVPALSAAAATGDATSSLWPPLITCQPSDGSWKAVVRLPPEPGGPVRVRLATLADLPLTGTIICCGEVFTLDAQGCVYVPWELMASAWNDGGIWVEREVGGIWVTAVVVERA